MLSASRLARCLVALLIVALSEQCIAPPASAQGIIVGLDVLYDNPLDTLSGGTWQVTGRSSVDTFGILQLSVFLTGINQPAPLPIGPRGFVNESDPAGFSVFGVQTLGANTYGLFIGQAPIGELSLDPGDEEAVFYGVGRLDNGAPGDMGPQFTSLIDVEGVPWSTGDVFGDPFVNTAVVLAEGVFDPGLTPDFFIQGVAIRTNGSVFTSLPPNSRDVGDFVLVDPANTSRRTNESTPDYNDNQFVDAADFTVWRDSLGQMGFGLAADGIKDGVIDMADYDFWKANFGLMVPGAGGGSGAPGFAGAGGGLGSVVPEPATIPLWLGTASALVLRRKTRVFRHVRFL